jgi:MerR family copper efflux transcriptional regulator
MTNGTVAREMNIGALAKQSGVAAKTIRYYEQVGLIPRASRSIGNYRRYDQRDVATLRFIHRARQLGFSLEDVGKLVGLWRDHRRSSVRVKQLVLAHVREIDRKLVELKTIRDTLSHLADHCHGDGRPDCPILDDLAVDEEASRQH